MRIGIIGGTGGLGAGLADRLLRHGHSVLIGSRDAAKAEAVAAELRAANPDGTVQGADNATVAREGEIVAITVPYASHLDTLRMVADELCGKILIDATVCLQPPKVGTVQIPAEGSACVQAQRFLGERVKVIAALQNISAGHLAGDDQIQCDVLVCGDDREAKDTVLGLIGTIGLDAWDAGPIENSVAVEAMTSVLISINRRHKLSGAGVRIRAAHG